MELVTKAAQNQFNRLWAASGLPQPSPCRDHWSLAYARDVYSLIATAMECDVPVETLEELLVNVEVWDADPTKQQWEPT